MTGVAKADRILYTAKGVSLYGYSVRPRGQRCLPSPCKHEFETQHPCMMRTAAGILTQEAFVQFLLFAAKLLQTRQTIQESCEG